MKKILLLMICSLVLINTSVTQAITIGFSPSSQSVTLGDSVNVDLVVSDLLASGHAIGAYDLDIGYDNTILDFTNLTFGSFVDLSGLSAMFGMQDYAPSPGSVNVFEISMDMPLDLLFAQPDSFTLATLTFSTLTTGTSALNLSINALGDEWGDPLVADLTSGSVDVTTPVPEPSTFLLLGIGLVGIRLLRRKYECG